MKTLYVSQEGKEYWSGSYPKPLEDMSDGPLNSIVSANTLIREEAFRGSCESYCVKIAGGTYRYINPILIDSALANPVTYMPVDGEEVVFSGGRTLTGLQNVVIHGRKAVQAVVPEALTGDFAVRELFVNHKPAQRTVYPADGSKLRIRTIFGGDITDPIGKCHSAFQVNAQDFAGIQNPENSEIVIVHYWVDERLPIVKYDKEKQLVFSDYYSRYHLVDDIANDYALYRIENVFEELKNPGQWYFDKNNGMVYYLLREGETAENITLEIPLCEQLLKITGLQNQKAGHVTFSNIQFECTRACTDGLGKFAATLYGEPVKSGSYGQGAPGLSAAVALENAEYCTFTGCTFCNIGNYAIEIGNGCRHHQIENCEIYNCGGGGIKIMGAGVGEPESQITAYNSIVNNHIHHNTRIFFTAIGIYVQNAFSTRIAHNCIHDMEYSGISCGWVWGYTESRSCCNIIEYNHIYNLGTGNMSDMGGIYMLGMQPGSEIRGNHIHDIKKANYGGWGIYLDEGSAYILVEKNIVHRAATAPFVIHYGKENMIRYNIFAFGELSCIGITRGDKYTQATFYKNIFVMDGGPFLQGGYNFHFGAEEAVSDNNFFFDIQNKPICNSYVHHEGAGDEIAAWNYWLAQHHDNSSFYGDPGFADLSTFSLAEDAPALKKGFPNGVCIQKAGNYEVKSKA